MKQRSGNLTAHLLPQGKHSGRCFHQISQIQKLRKPFKVFPVKTVLNLVNVLQQTERIRNRHIPPELAALSEYNPQTGDMTLPVLPGCEAAHSTGPAVRPKDTAEDFDCSAFSRAVWADVPDDLPVGYGKAHVLQSLYPGILRRKKASYSVSQAGISAPYPVGFGYPFHFDHFFCLLIR